MGQRGFKVRTTPPCSEQHASSQHLNLKCLGPVADVLSPRGTFSGLHVSKAAPASLNHSRRGRWRFWSPKPCPASARAHSMQPQPQLQTCSCTIRANQRGLGGITIRAGAAGVSGRPSTAVRRRPSATRRGVPVRFPAHPLVRHPHPGFCNPRRNPEPAIAHFPA